MGAQAFGIGIDFGTTNSALAWAGPGGASEVAAFGLMGEVVRTFRSILYFEAECAWERGRPVAMVGPEAIEGYLDNDGEGRLMQSLKSFLASRLVSATSVFGYDYPFEALIARIVEGLWDGAEPQLRAAGWGGAVGGRRPRVSVGRPVRFVGSQDEAADAYAAGRLRKALQIAGFEEVDLVLEPVAAALHYESGLDEDETVLVADFGGGTSDFSLLRVGPSFAERPGDADRVLGTRGVGLAGDALDARIVQQVVAPALGQGSHYRSMMGKVLEIPRNIFEKLKRWNELSILKTRQNMDMLNGYLRGAVEPDKIEALIHLVEHNLGYRLYRAVEATKVELSSREAAELRFEDEGRVIAATITRADFEGWIGPELEAIESCVEELMAGVGFSAHEVDTVFLTGGTGQVPAVRRIFEARFGGARVRTGQFLTSIASGLALHARG